MYYNRYDGGSRGCANSCPSISTDPWLITEARHNGGLNVGYLDGHVKWQSYQAAYPANRTTDSSKDEMRGLGLR
jgi:prepilin-type processing-associated H-X9-DG protein